MLCAFRSGGAEAPAYTSIVASGANACVLHYVFNNQPLRDGDLLLIDAAASSVAMRPTSPHLSVNGRFSAARRMPMNWCWPRRRRRSARCVGSHWNARRGGGAGIDAGHGGPRLLHGEVDGLLESKAYERFYMHRTATGWAWMFTMR